MLPQNGHQARQQSGLPSFMNTNTSLDSASFFNLDPSAAAKQMAALNAASQARIASNTRPSASIAGGTSSGPYLGGINSVNYPAGNHDLLGSSNNAHANFQMPNSHNVPQTPNMSGSFIDSSMSQTNPRNSAQGNTLKHRQQGFLHGLASVMAKRGNPLPPSLTGISAPNYDANKTVWTMIEPSSEVGSFRLAGKDIPLFKLWGLVFQAGGGPTLTANNGWDAILPHFDLPAEFPQIQPNGSASVSLMLSQYYMAILYPFEETYKRNLQDQQKRAMLSRQGGTPAQQSSIVLPGQNRPQGVGGQANISGQMLQRGGLGNSMNSMSQQVSNISTGSSISTPYQQSLNTPQISHQRPPTAPEISGIPNPAHSINDMDSVSVQVSGHAPDNNLLDQDLPGIKRKLETDDGDNKRVRQKTEPLDVSSLVAGLNPDRSFVGLSAGVSQVNNSTTTVGRPRTQPSRRKIEYVPLAREVESYGGRDLKYVDNEWANLAQRRPLRDINDWGVMDIEGLTMSIRSRLSTELSYALTSLTLMSTMRGQNPGSGLPISDCVDLLEETLDLLDEQAFGGPESTSPGYAASDDNVTTHRDLVNFVFEAESQPFVSLESRQGFKEPNLGPQQRPANIILATVNIIRNLSVFTNNVEFMSRHDRIVDILLRLCGVIRVEGKLRPASAVLSLPDLVLIRKDTLLTLSNIAGLIDLSSNSLESLRKARRTFDLIASYLNDPLEAVSPFASIQPASAQSSGNVKPSSLVDIALEAFTRFSQSDNNRQILSQAISPESISRLFSSLIHRLPLVDADFHLMQREIWLSYLEKIIMAIYSLAFLATPETKQSLKADRTLGFRAVMLRMIQKFLLNPNPESRLWFLVCARRSIEAMKILDDGNDSFDTSESVPPTMSFGMGYGETGDTNADQGTGLLAGHREAAWDILMLREVLQDEVMFAELESLTRVEVEC